MNIYPKCILESTWSPKPWVLGSQIVQWSAGKIWHVMWHFLFGVIFAWIALGAGFLIIFLSSSAIVALRSGIVTAIIAGVTTFGYFQGGQIFWENIYTKKYEGILMNVFDLIEYYLGVSTVFFMLFAI